MAVSEGFQPVKSAGRALDVLEALADSPGRRSLMELARDLGIPKSSLHGILRTLTQRGWVETDETGTRFRLGLRALQVGAAYLAADDVVGLVSGALDELSRRFGETVHFGRLDGAYVVYLAKRESVHPLRLYSAIGRRLPAHATALGKALLPQRDDYEELLTWPLPALTPRTITDRERLRAEPGRGARARIRGRPRGEHRGHRLLRRGAAAGRPGDGRDQHVGARGAARTASRAGAGGRAASRGGADRGGPGPGREHLTGLASGTTNQ